MLETTLSPASEEAGETPTDEPLGTLEPVAYFYHAMPTGVTVSQRGRIFVNYAYALFRVRIEVQPVLLK